MVNNLTIFKNESFGQVRTVEVDGKTYFVAFDIAKALKYARPNDAVNKHCPHTLKHSIGVQTGIKKDSTPAIQMVDMNIIPEGDVYRLIVNSKLPTAEKFERWVFDEVLVSIRKTGGYVSGNETDFIIRSAVTQAVETIAAQIPVIVLETIKAVNATGRQAEKAPYLDYFDRLSCFPQSKVESFPPEIQDMVDTMLDQMKAEESFNFSRVARLCTVQGFSITSPTIKKYYDKKFGNL